MRTANHSPESLDADVLPAYMLESQKSRRLERLQREAAALLRSALSSSDAHHLRTVTELALRVLEGKP